MGSSLVTSVKKSSKVASYEVVSSHNREDVPKTARSLDTQATHEPHTPNPIFDCGRRWRRSASTRDG